MIDLIDFWWLFIEYVFRSVSFDLLEKYVTFRLVYLSSIVWNYSYVDFAIH